MWSSSHQPNEEITTLDLNKTEAASHRLWPHGSCGLLTFWPLAGSTHKVFSEHAEKPLGFSPVSARGPAVNPEIPGHTGLAPAPAGLPHISRVSLAGAGEVIFMLSSLSVSG